MSKKIPEWIKRQYGRIISSLEKKPEVENIPPQSPQCGLIGSGKARAALFSVEEIESREKRREKARKRKPLQKKRRLSNKRETVRNQLPETSLKR